MPASMSLPIDRPSSSFNRIRREHFMMNGLRSSPPWRSRGLMGEIEKQWKQNLLEICFKSLQIHKYTGVGEILLYYHFINALYPRSIKLIHYKKT